SCLSLIRAPPSFTLFPYTTLFRSQLIDRLAEVTDGSCVNAVKTASEIDAVQIQLHDLLLIELALNPARQKGFGQLPGQCALMPRSEEHTSELQSRENLVCRLLLEK